MAQHRNEDTMPPYSPFKINTSNQCFFISDSPTLFFLPPKLKLLIYTVTRYSLSSENPIRNKSNHIIKCKAKHCTVPSWCHLTEMALPVGCSFPYCSKLKNFNVWPQVCSWWSLGIRLKQTNTEGNIVGRQEVWLPLFGGVGIGWTVTCMCVLLWREEAQKEVLYCG